MPKFNHMYDIAFTIVSEAEDGSDVTPAMLREALLKRAAEMADEDFPEACGLCDTYEILEG